MTILQNNSFKNISNKIAIIFAILILEQNKMIAASIPEPIGSSATIDNNIRQNVVNGICTTPICQQEASFYLNLMNQEVDPCDNFYQFSCGNFIKNADIPKGSNRYTVIDSVKTKIDRQLLSELQNKKPDDSATFKKMKILHQNCVKEPQQESIQLVLDTLNKLGGMPLLQGDKWNEDTFDWVESTLKSYDYGVPPTFPAKFYPLLDRKNNSRNQLNIFSPITRINDNFFMNDPDKKLLEAYRDFMIDIMVMLGANKSEAIKEMTDCLDFEVKLYNIKSPTNYLRNSTFHLNPVTIKNLSELCPSIPWLTYLNRIFNPINVPIDDNELVIVRDIAAMKNLTKLISETPKKLLANYIMWQVVYELVDVMPEKFLDRLQVFLQSIKSGSVKERKTRAAHCTDFMVNYFTVGINALYSQKFVSKGSRENAAALIQTVKSHFGKMLKEVEWMDDKTKKYALEKLEAMDYFDGCHPEFFDDEKIDNFHEDLNISDGNFFVSALNLSRFNRNTQLKSLRNPLSYYSWINSIVSTVINAYYVQYINEIDIAASLLQPPFYGLERPQYLNYGVLGQVIGHEITHGFDSEGRKLDKTGNRVNWWDPSTQQRYIEKSKCFVDKYFNYTVAEVGLRINGNQTLRENIADFGGFKVAHGAYVDWANRNNITEPRLPGLDYTPRQMYWISLASFYCGKFNEEYLANEVAQDGHSAREARVILTLSNLPEFAEDFSCKPNTRMNPVDKCNLW